MRIFTASLVGSAFAALLCSTVQAQSDWQAAWAKTVAAAEQEGELVLYVAPGTAMRTFFQEAWPRDFPKIKLQQSAIPVAQFFMRIRTERSGGKFLWDAAVHGTSAGSPIVKDGALDPLQPEFLLPEVRDPAVWGGWDSAFYDVGKQYMLATQKFLKMPYYNAKMVPPEKVERLGVKLLLDPEYKGKIVWHDPAVAGSGRTFAYVLRKLLGDDGLKQFVVGQQVLLPSTQKEVVDRMGREEKAIGLGPPMEPELDIFAKAGLQLDIRPFGNRPEAGAYMNIGGTALMVYNQRPHPNATRVFVNWFLSRATQAEFAKAMDQNSRRRDVASVVPPERTPIEGAQYYEPQREEFLDEVEAAQDYVTRIRGQN
jgi:ABC-type glycerol-3-phosphate transport system substrate-binding protein